jgi:hypothetical protein
LKLELKDNKLETILSSWMTNSSNNSSPPYPLDSNTQLAPGQVNPTNALDYTMFSGIKIWHEVTAPLSFKFNVEGKEVLNTFCEALAQ